MILTITFIAIIVLLVIYFVKKSWLISMGQWIFSRPALAILLIVFAIIGLAFVLSRIFNDLNIRTGFHRKDKK